MMMRMAAYMDGLKRKSYPELMRERERLLYFMHTFEAEETAGERNAAGRQACPAPEIRYQVYFEYLSVLCGVMRERYRRDYASGRRTLKEEAGAETEENGAYA